MRILFKLLLFDFFKLHFLLAAWHSEVEPKRVKCQNLKFDSFGFGSQCTACIMENWLRRMTSANGDEVTEGGWKYLRHSEQQCHSVEEVGVGAASVDPEVPEHREQRRTSQQGAGHQEDVPQNWNVRRTRHRSCICAPTLKIMVWSELTSMEVTPHGEEGQVQGGVAHGGVGFEDWRQGQLHEHQKERMFPGRHFPLMTSTCSMDDVVEQKRERLTWVWLKVAECRKTHWSGRRRGRKGESAQTSRRKNTKRGQCWGWGRELTGWKKDNVQWGENRLQARHANTLFTSPFDPNLRTTSVFTDWRWFNTTRN